MFNTLRSRLWLSYALIVLMVLVVGSIGLIVALRQSPLLYRQVINRLDVTSELLVRRFEPFINLPTEQFQDVFSEETVDSDVQVAVVNINGNYLASNFQDDNDIVAGIQRENDLQQVSQSEISIYKDAEGEEWFYKVQSIGSDYYLLTASFKPQYSFSMIVKDEFLGPLMQAGLIVMLIAIFISLFISNWITLPLKRMSESAEALSKGDLINIPLQGPKEVRRLAQTFNTMSQKITASARSQREFIVSVSHEFKTPLTSIQGFAQAILDGTVQSKKEINKAANVILIETNRLNRLMLDLLMLARLEAGTEDMRVEEISIKVLLQNMVDKFSILAEQNEVQLKLNEVPDVFVRGDGDRLAQVFSNVIDNALKFTPSHGKVEIGACVVENDILIQIEDSGIGIPLDEQEKIFERFYQIDSSRKYGKKKGFGLGLSIAREIIQSHHGQIWVENNPDEGSVFFVKLPIFMNKR
ncbi:MAG TPA: hypothetical protein DCK95_08290 [Anaerolineaceae bacterium]|uniref:histidine kinase n=1 Tax=Anaerolinea thermophila TaxID=167964 RepID=A0A101FWX1_9CHLR|nr:MAG: Two-component sensor histidine kinase [Anaerolinea thermophila]HAF62310.1 hypothetical protein [Anaerolineaceae bacterium]